MCVGLCVCVCVCVSWIICSVGNLLPVVCCLLWCYVSPVVFIASVCRYNIYISNKQQASTKIAKQTKSKKKQNEQKGRGAQGSLGCWNWRTMGCLCPAQSFFLLSNNTVLKVMYLYYSSCFMHSYMLLAINSVFSPAIGNQRELLLKGSHL